MPRVVIPGVGGGGKVEVKAGNAAGRRVAATYDYRDEKGDLLYQAVRFEPKAFCQRRPDGKGGWIWNLQGGVRLVLYGLPELLALAPEIEVHVVEGEKDANTLRALGLAATCNPMGAGKWPKVAELAKEVLRGRRVVIIADKDGPGRNHAATVAASLNGSAAIIRVLEMPGEAKDVSDWIAAGGTAEGLRALVDAAPEWSLPPQGPAPADAPRPQASLPSPADNGASSPLRPKTDPYWVVAHDVGEGDRHDALLALAGALVGAGVSKGSTKDVVQRANSQNCRPPLADREVASIIKYVLDAEGKSSSGGTPFSAVRAFIRANLAGVEYLPSSLALSATWLPTGEIVEWRIGGERDLQADAIGTVGDLLSLAKRACTDATPRMVLRALRDLAPSAPVPDSEDEGDEADRLVTALLFGPIWVSVPDGERTVMRRAILAEVPGLYPAEGVGLELGPGSQAHLLVNVVAAVSGVLKDNPDFGRGRRTIARLGRILTTARGYIGRARSGALRALRWHCIDVTDLLSGVDEDKPSTGPDGTDGTP